MKKRQNETTMQKSNPILIMLVILFAILSIIPLYWMFLNSLMANNTVMQVPPPLILEKATWVNYIYVWQRSNFPIWLFNSVFVSGVVTVGAVYICSLAAYPLAKQKFPGSRFLFWLAIAFLTVPRQVILLPLFMTFMQWKLFDTYAALILPGLAAPFGLFLMKQMMGTVPGEIIEAAEIDGCSHLGIFHRIVIPIIKPGIAALAVFVFNNTWNDYIWQLIIIKSPKMTPIPLGVASFTQDVLVNYGHIMAAAACGSIPLLIIFFSFQRYFVSGITIGAVKG